MCHIITKNKKIFQIEIATHFDVDDFVFSVKFVRYQIALVHTNYHRHHCQSDPKTTSANVSRIQYLQKYELKLQKINYK